MSFTEYAYRRPNLKRLTTSFEKYVAEFDLAATPEAAADAFKKINRLRRTFSTAYNLGHIRHTIDTTDAFYDAENTFFDENSPTFEALEISFYRKLITHRFRADLEKIFGQQLFIIAELKIKTFEPVILTGMQDENKLSSEYAKLKATARIEHEGKTYNLSSFHTFEIDPDRVVRKEASTKKWAFFSENAPKIEKIYDDAVKTRHKIATDLGYKNFVELGYMRMLRSDYNAPMVANFRKQVQEFIVPLSSALYERQRKRLKINELNYYDEEFRFVTGNPKPEGTPEDILRGADTMYRELSKDTDRFFQFMRANNLMDLVTRDNKATGGYCTYIDGYRSPYIFSNFNGTSGDIDVLTHEAGHAFQVFSSRNKTITEYNWPTYEACEIHSMSMEFFTWKWMPLFFGEDANKYYFSHMSSALQFLPYGVAVDEFQHFVYENPTATPSVRNQKWRDIEKIYLPHRKYDGNEFLENGGLWQKQNHIFASPFYYIDYTLAQICAFQFWKKDRENHGKAWSDYVRLCKAGGSLSFLKLVDLANLRSPFEDGCVESVIGDITAWLDAVDDSQF
ncbi:MAG: M3 family oligoendopeptidase [Saprospiraceae bacterium]|nr:M3 family oligoendopeptidase [Saprospiraceae bacterium]